MKAKTFDQQIHQLLRDGKLDQAYERASVERRQRMNGEDAWRDILEDLRDAAEVRTMAYDHELRKPRPHVSVLIGLWCEHWEAMELAMSATPPGSQQDEFKAEMALCDKMIDQLSAPYLKLLKEDA